MSNLIAGLVHAQALAFWAAGVGIAFAWLSHGKAWFRFVAFAGALLWPLIPTGIALVEQASAATAAERFADLCAKDAVQTIRHRSEPISEFFVEVANDKNSDSFLNRYANEFTSRLVLERPGYQKVQITAAGKTVIHRRGQNLVHLTKAEPVEPKRFGVKLEFDADKTDSFVRPFRMEILDRKNRELLAEQRSFLYRSGDIGFLGIHFWRAQERTCPLAHPADFVRTALLPARVEEQQ